MRRGFFSLFPQAIPFHFCHPKKNPGTFLCHLFISSLSLSLAFHIFFFLRARISSAGHRHSFPTGSLCLDIPTPPSVLCSPAPYQENQSTGNSFHLFSPLWKWQPVLHQCNTSIKGQSDSARNRRSKCWIGLQTKMCCTLTFRQGRAYSVALLFNSDSRLGVALQWFWSGVSYALVDYLVWGFVRGWGREGLR